MIDLRQSVRAEAFACLAPLQTKLWQLHALALCLQRMHGCCENVRQGCPHRKRREPSYLLHAGCEQHHGVIMLNGVRMQGPSFWLVGVE